MESPESGHIELCEDCDEMVFLAQNKDLPIPNIENMRTAIIGDGVLFHDEGTVYYFYDVEEVCVHGCCLLILCWNCRAEFNAMGIGTPFGPECPCQGGTDERCG